MQPPNGTDFLSRNTILIIVMLAVLAQLCSIQLAHGEEKFLTGDSSGLAIEIRPEATVVGDDIRTGTMVELVASPPERTFVGGSLTV